MLSQKRKMCLKTVFIFCIWLHVCLSIEELDDYTYRDRLLEFDFSLVMFYVPWCVHCETLRAEFLKASIELSNSGLFLVDCTTNGKETCELNYIQSYPTVAAFYKGTFVEDYNGPRTASAIVDYMENHIGAGSKKIASMEALEKMLKTKNDLYVIGIFKSDSKLNKTFFEVVRYLSKTVKFAQSDNTTILGMEGIILFRPYYLWNNFEENKIVYSGNKSAKDIENFIKKNQHGLVGHRTFENHQDFTNPSIVAYYDVDFSKNPKNTNYWRNRILKVAQKFKDKITFAISNQANLKHELLDYTGRISEDFPTVIARNAEEQEFLMEEPITVENLEKFANNFLQGKLEIYYKSEPIPERNDGPVFIAVARNFDEVVVNNGKDTVVAFYAPWCSYCQNLAPSYEKLARKLQNEEIVFVKIDATTNEVPQNYSVGTYPTVYWKPKDSKYSPVLYEGLKDFKALLQFIAQEAAQELKGFDRKGNEKTKTEL